MITNKQLKKVIGSIDKELKYYNEEVKKGWQKRDFVKYEKKLMKRIKFAIINYQLIIEKAINLTSSVKLETRGRKSKLTLQQKVTLLLLKQLFRKSNREMEFLSLVFSALTNIDISYKTIERLYSDFEVYIILQNILIITHSKLDLKDLNLSGDGTGYSLLISKNYKKFAVKMGDKGKKGKNQTINKKKKIKKKIFVYSFQILDLKTRLYIAYGSSFKSEDQAFKEAIKMLDFLNIKNIKSIRLDKYYSNNKKINFITSKIKGITIYVIPKINATIKGSNEWKLVLTKFVTNIQEYFSQYYLRNNSENAFSEDKRRFGGEILQKRLDRIDTAIFTKVLWHNLFNMETMY